VQPQDVLPPVGEFLKRWSDLVQIALKKTSACRYSRLLGQWSKIVTKWLFSESKHVVAHFAMVSRRPELPATVTVKTTLPDAYEIPAVYSRSPEAEDGSGGGQLADSIV